MRLPPAAAAAGLAAPPPAAAAPPSAGASPPPIESMMTAGRMYIQYLRREGWGWGAQPPETKLQFGPAGAAQEQKSMDLGKEGGWS